MSGVDPRSFAGRLLLSLGLVGLLFVTSVAVVVGLAAREYAHYIVDAQIARAAATVDTVLAAQERQLLSGASTFARLEPADGIEGDDMWRSRASLDAALRAYNSDLVAVVTDAEVVRAARRDDLGSAAGRLAVAALDRVVIEEVDGLIWMLSSARLQIPQGSDAIVLMGRHLDDAFLEEVDESAGLLVALRLGGSGAGPEQVTSSTRVAYEYRSRFGGVLEVILYASLIPHDAAVRQSLIVIVGASITALAIFLALTATLVFRLTRPLRELAHVAASVGAGQLRARAPIDGPTEIAMTGQAINRMVEAISVREDRLRSLHAEAVVTATQRDHEAKHDDLTGLPNRKLLTERVAEAIGISIRDGVPVALLIIDLDRFKRVNDAFGHQAGDDLLRQAAGRLRKAVRAADTVARLGGDEFAMVLPGVDRGSAVAMAKKVVRALEQPFLLADRQVLVSGSVGLAICPDHATVPEILFRQADLAMYASKRQSIGPVVYETSQELGAPGLELLSDLREAIAGGAIQVQLQPIVEVSSGRPLAVEALARWTHPTHGPISPSDFIPLAEANGLITPLTVHVLREALRHASSWRAHGFVIPVCVNLSARDLADGQLSEIIPGLLRSAGVPASGLSVEITESALMADVEPSIANLSCLRSLGIRVSVDDFGTGYSSLAYLKRLPIDQLKIDRSFIAESAQGTNSATIVRATIELAHGLGFEVVAEGVESSAALDQLRGFGCDAAQGYYISRPLDPPQLLSWLQRDRPHLLAAAHHIGTR